MAERSYDNEDAFHREDVRRRDSVEFDYGARWTMENSPGTWRISYVRETGEIYALRFRGAASGPLLLLGRGPAKDHHAVDRVLEGWEQENHSSHRLEWAMERIATQLEGKEHQP